MSAKQRRTDKEIIQTRAIQTREKLLQAALKMYTQQGYYATTKKLVFLLELHTVILKIKKNFYLKLSLMPL